MSMETDRIEADLQQSRHRLNDTLEALGQKLSPGQMVDEVLGLAQGQAGDFAKKLGSQVKDNPLPTLLIAAGVGMGSPLSWTAGVSPADASPCSSSASVR